MNRNISDRREPDLIYIPFYKLPQKAKKILKRLIHKKKKSKSGII